MSLRYVVKVEDLYVARIESEADGVADTVHFTGKQREAATIEYNDAPAIIRVLHSKFGICCGRRVRLVPKRVAA